MALAMRPKEAFKMDQFLLEPLAACGGRWTCLFILSPLHVSQSSRFNGSRTIAACGEDNVMNKIELIYCNKNLYPFLTHSTTSIANLYSASGAASPQQRARL